MLRRLTLAWLLVAFFTGLSLPEARATDDPAATRLANELRFRRDFGLVSDVSYVKQLMADPAAYNGEYPVALTVAEREEMDRRIAMEDEMVELEVYARAQPTYGGHWIDQPAGGNIVVAFAGDADLHRAAVEALAPERATVQVINVARTMAELRAVDDSLWDDRHALQAEGILVRHWEIDVRNNELLVGIEKLDPTIESDLRDRYGAAIRAVESRNPTFTSHTGCTSRTDCYGPPIRAGISGAPLNAYPCSLAFLIHAGSPVGWLTAGHCAQTTGVVWYHSNSGSRPLGTIRATCWPQCTFSDAARAGELNATYSSYHVYNGQHSTVAVTASQALNADDIGDYTCLNARRTEAWRCGYIDAIGTVCYEEDASGNCTLWFDEQRWATYSAYSGDSGGAVHSAIITYGVRAYGVQSGCEDFDGGGCEPGHSDGRAIYSHIARVMSEIGQGTSVSVCTASAPCP